MTSLEKENKILRRLLFLNHGHAHLYTDDGEMQCEECIAEYGFYDWKRTPNFGHVKGESAIETILKESFSKLAKEANADIKISKTRYT